MATITFVLFLLMMGLLFYRWMQRGEPNGFILVRGTKALDGAQVSVLDPVSVRESHQVMNAADNYLLRFPLPQGTYQVSVTLNDKTLMNQSVGLREGVGVVLNLDEKILPATEPSTTEPVAPVGMTPLVP